MAKFDFIDAVNRGYGFCFKHRSLVARLCLIPVLVKFFCFVSVVALGYEDNVLRQGLFLLPSYFLEGWLLAHLLRIAFFNELGLWQLRASPSTENTSVKNRNQDIWGGTLVYVLLKVLSTAVIGVVSGAEGLPEPNENIEIEPSLPQFVAAFMLLLMLFWLFRVSWLYIPVVFGCSMRFYFKRLGGLTSSAYLLAAWLLSFLPLILLTILGLDFLRVVFDVQDTSGSLVFKFAGLAWQAVMETLIGVFTTMVLGYGIYEMLSGKPAEKLKP